MENYTKNGLLLILIGMIIGMVSSVLFFILQSIILSEDFLGLFFGFIGISLIGGIGGIIILIGAILFFVGRKEFNDRHQRFVIYAVLLVGVNLIIVILLVIIGVFLRISNEGVYSSFLTVITTIIGVILGGLVYIIALYELEDKKGRYLLYFSYIVSIIFAVIIAFYTMSEVSGFINEVVSTEDQQTNFSSMMTFFSGLSNVSILSVFSNILWVIALYIPYKRIKDGDLVPKFIKTIGKEHSIADRVCPNCNKAIPNDAIICPYCENKFDNFL